MSQDEDLEYELKVSRAINQMVDRMAELMSSAAEDAGIDYEVKPEEIADVKMAIKQLVPHKSPTTAFMTAQGLMALIMWAHDQDLLKQAQQEDSDIIERISEGLADDESTRFVLDQLQGRQERLARQYKDVSVNKHRLKVADLGDVSSGISYN